MSARAPCQTSAGALSPPQQDHIDDTLPDHPVQHDPRVDQPITPCCVRRQLLALHRTAVLRHDNYGQETLLNLLLRNYLQYSLYDQVSAINTLVTLASSVIKSRCRDNSLGLLAQAEKLRSKAQKGEVWRSNQQLCRYLYYLGRIRAIQLDYTDAKDCLQQAARKASALPMMSIRSDGRSS